MSAGMIVLFAVASGLAVGSNYLAQPLLDTLRREFHVTVAVAGLLVTVSQIGYATGLVMLLPLGDLLERRWLITTLAGLTSAGLAAAALAPSIGPFAAAVGLVGLTSVMAQLLAPFAATLAPEAERGRVVGAVMSGLLLGILLARTASGLVAAAAGWRVVYGSAAALMFVLTFVLYRVLPTYRERVALTYPRLLASVLTIARSEPELRRCAVHGMCAVATFSALWTTLAFLLAGPRYGYGEGVIGLFGLVGAAGALTVSVVGRFTDRGWAHRLTGVMSALLVAGYALLWLGGTSLGALVAGILVLDVGVQGLFITNQTDVFRLQPEARNRLNAFYVTACFVGAALGSATAALAYSAAGWNGVCVIGAGFGLASTLWWAAGPRSRAAGGR